MRQHTNIALLPVRRLKKQYDGTSTWHGNGGANALGNTNPNTLNTNLPSRANATGLTGKNGIVSFLHNGANQTITLYFWSERLNRINTAQGWIAGAETAAGSAKTVNQYALASFTAPEDVPFFLQATGTDITECLVSGASDGANDNTDPTGSGGGT